MLYQHLKSRHTVRSCGLSLLLRSALFFISCCIVTASEENTVYQSLRTRKLPGESYFDFDIDSLASAEAGFAAGAVFVVVLLIILICCCCGRCSLWDIVAMVCLWEMCCDREVDPSAFAAF